MVYEKRTLKPMKSPACPAITTGDSIVDRKSVFQGHCAIVNTMEDVEAVLSELQKNNKISHAKHNVYVYRIEAERAGKKVILQDFDNDGEAQAGGRLAHLVELLQVRNVLVVVTRWYGGVQIGADRFRHYNNAARQVLLQAGLVAPTKKK